MGDFNRSFSVVNLPPDGGLDASSLTQLGVSMQLVVRIVLT